MTTQPDSRQAPEFTIAERLYLARTIAKYEKQRLADAIGVSRDTIANYESRDWGRKRSPAYLKAWALACGVSYEWLQTGQPGPDAPVGLRMGYLSGSMGHEARIIPFHLAA